MSTVSYRPDIDGLRALAVLPVVVFHVSPTLVPGGFLGVDIFFVISGYLISLILFRQQADGNFRFAEFYHRRVRRLFPALIVVLVTCLGFGYFALLADEYARLGRHTAFAVIFLLNLQLMGEAGYFDLASFGKPLLHLWSLSVEEQFYVFWPILLLLASRLRLRVGWWLGVCAALSFTYAVWLGGINPDAPYYHPLTRFWELLAGAFAAYLHHRKGVNWLPAALAQPGVRSVLSVAALLLLGGALMTFGKGLQHPGPATLWPVLGAVALILTGPLALANRALALRPLVMVGLISYPLYLWHWPVLSYVSIAESGRPASWMLWFGAGFSVVLATLTYRCAELPFRGLSDRWRSSTGLATAMGALFAASLAIAANDGLPGRPAQQYIKDHQAVMVREPVKDKSCVALFEGANAPFYCRLHKPGGRMLAVIGDSHAHVLFPGVSELAAARGYGTLMLANSGCPPLIGAVTGRNATERQQCARNIETIIDAVLADRRIDTVVIATRGPQYLTGQGFGPVEAHYNYPPITTEPLPVDGTKPDPGRVFTDGLHATALQLHQRGIRVSYLLQVPELGVPARDCLGRPLTLSQRADWCPVSFVDYQSRMHDYRAQVLALSARVPYLQIIDVESLLCSPPVCSGMVGGQLLYADDNHLSVAGSRKVAPLILQAAVKGPPHR